MCSAAVPETNANDFAAAVDTLRARLRGEALTELDDDYDFARAVWNAMIDRRPRLIVRCKGAADVMDAVEFARNHSLPVSIRGGAHNVAGHAVCDGGVMIDLSLMRSVWVDPDARRARVEGGCTWGDVDRETQAFGLATPGGLISDTGVAGLTLAGGIGWLRSRYGLCIDNIVSADVVTADGNLVTASADENPDLFWALRGGGGNFGVVVSFEFALHPMGPTVMFAAPIYPLSADSGPIRFWRDFLADKHDDVGSIVEFSTIPEDPDFPEEYWGQRCYTIAALYAGDANEGERLLQPLREQGELVADFSDQMEYCDVQSLFDTVIPFGQQPLLLEVPFLVRLAGRDDRTDYRERSGGAVGQHLELALELWRRDSQGAVERDRSGRSLDGLDVFHRLNLERARRRRHEHHLDARCLGANSKIFARRAPLSQLCWSRRRRREAGAGRLWEKLRSAG